MPPKGGIMNLNEAYFKAVSNGHFEQVTYYIDNGVNVDIKDNRGETALHKAMKNGYREIVKLLIKKGANLRDSKNLILLAAEKGYLDIVISLLKYENDSNIRKQALDLAQKIATQKELFQGIQEQNYDKVKKAIENNADLNEADMLSWSPLMNAVIKKDVNIVKLLVKNFADINYNNKNNETVLMKAVESADTYIVEFLLENKAKVNSRDLNGNTALFYAVEYGDFDMVKLLIKYGAKINLKNNDGDDVLNLAVKKNYVDIVKYLIKKGAFSKRIFKTAYDNENYCLLKEILAYENDKETVKYWEDRLDALDLATKLRIMINLNDYQGVKKVLKSENLKNLNELLYLAVKKSRYEIVKYFINKGANVNYYRDNVSLLMAAVSKGDLKMVKLLVNLKAEVNGKGNFILGYPLTIAVNEGYLDIVKYLISKGADINKGYGFKLSAKEEALKSENLEIKEFFKSF